MGENSARSFVSTLASSLSVPLALSHSLSLARYPIIWFAIRVSCVVFHGRALHRIAVVVVQGADIVYDGLEGLLAQRALGFDLA